MTEAETSRRETSGAGRTPPSGRSPRRLGREGTKSRNVILDAVEKLLLEEGYASVTYRGLAAKAQVTPALVQYYFPTLDEIFVATIRRNVDGHVARLVATLQERSHEPLRVIWEFSKEEVTGALTMEFIALGNHRKSIRAEIAEIAERVRQVQLDAIRSTTASLRHSNGEFSPPVLMFLLTGIPKLLTIETNLGVSTSHAEVIEAFERFLDSVEPRRPISTKGSVISQRKSTGQPEPTTGLIERCKTSSK